MSNWIALGRARFARLTIAERIAGVVCVVVAAIGTYLMASGRLALVTGAGIPRSTVPIILLTCAAITFVYAHSLARLRKQVALAQRLEAAEQSVRQNPDKVAPVWESARLRLEVHFERNLAHSQAVFRVTVGVLLIGFLLVAYGIWQAIDRDSLLPASVLATSAGFLTEIVGAGLLVLYKSMVQQAGQHVSTLERINAVGMALQVLDSIPEGQELKHRLRRDLCLQIVSVLGEPRASH